MSSPGWSLLPIPTHPKGKEPTNNSGFLFCCFTFGATPGGAKGFLLTLHSGINQYKF